MIVELTGGGPLDGDRAEVDDAVRSIVLTKANFMAFLQPLGPLVAGMDDGYVRVGAYVATEVVGPPTTFCWVAEE